jgi:hypothetical protein
VSSLQAAHDCNLVGMIVQLLPRVVHDAGRGVTMDTLEAVTYLLQRMQVGGRVVQWVQNVQRTWPCLPGQGQGWMGGPVDKDGMVTPCPPIGM